MWRIATNDNERRNEAMVSNPARSEGKKLAPPAALGLWKKNLRPVESVAWFDIDASTIRGAVDAVSRAGGAIMFGRTTDGGAYSVLVLYRDEKVKEYKHSVAECEELLRDITASFADEL